MDYRLLEQEELRSLRILQNASENTAIELEENKLMLRSVQIKSSLPGGDRDRFEETNSALDALLSQREEIRLRLKQNQLRLKRIGSALDALSEDDRRILTECYIVHGKKPEDIMDFIGVEKSSFYRRRYEALERFTRAMFGVVLT